MIKFLLLFALAVPGNHWTKVKDSYKVHANYLDHYGNFIGGYYQPKKPTFQVHEVVNPFTAQCSEGKPAEFATEYEAKSFVTGCPQ